MDKVGSNVNNSLHTLHIQSSASQYQAPTPSEKCQEVTSNLEKFDACNVKL